MGTVNAHDPQGLVWGLGKVQVRPQAHSDLSQVGVVQFQGVGGRAPGERIKV